MFFCAKTCFVRAVKNFMFLWILKISCFPRHVVLECQKHVFAYENMFCYTEENFYGYVRHVVHMRGKYVLVQKDVLLHR